MDWKEHLYRVGSNEWADDNLPVEPKEHQAFEKQCRKHIEPWLSAVFQSCALPTSFSLTVGRTGIDKQPIRVIRNGC